jgi:hypothetical protein
MTDAAFARTAMEGGGYYNRNSSLQEAGTRLALPFLEAATDAVPIDGPTGAPLVIADYGSSQGRNSMRPMALAIDRLRARAGPDRPIEVVHTDLPSNDFTSLFMALQDDGASYLTNRPGVFPSAVGRSYFEPILPAARVLLGWNTWTLHWLSRNPVDVADNVVAAFSASGRDREAARTQSAADLSNFLAARSVELAPGAKLVSLSMGATPELHGWDWVIGTELWGAARDMAGEGLLTQTELTRFTIPVAGRTEADLEAPFAAGDFHGLSLDYAKVLDAPDPFWEEFQATGDAGQLGKRWKGMLRAVSGPIAAAAFGSRPNVDALVDKLFDRLEARIAAAPQPHRHFVAITVVSQADRAAGR